MKKLVAILGTAVLLAGCNMAAPAPEDTATDGTVDTTTMVPEDAAGMKTVMLAEQNDSGQTGTVVLKELEGQVMVSVTMEGAVSAVPQPAHIHVGKCPTPGAVKYPLTNVVNGMSETTLDVSMADLEAAGELAINVHKSAEEVSVYIACGDM
jgi:hypothetical protein